MSTISDNELQNVSRLDPFQRYSYLIKRIADSATLWILKSQHDEIALSEIDDHVLLSIWSAKEYIQSCMKGIWENYIPASMDLDDFNEVLAPLIDEKQYLIDVFPVNGKSGFVVSLDEFVRDLNIELDKY